MAGLIPQHFIDDLLARTDIVDVIDTYVPLKKAGKNHQACCPFHDEKTPSFTVSQQKQFYHCFGCGANGSAIGFLMEYLNIGFVEAVEELASRAGLEIPREATEQTKSNSQTSELYELLEMTNKFYLKQLRKHPQAKRLIDYLKGRGISGEIAKQYELGFAPPGWDSLIKELGRSDAAQKRLLKIGAIIENDRGSHYDRFRDRLMFPIRDQRGRVIGFGGRVLDDSKPKYLNSPETPVFHKGRELYGLYQARKSLKENDCIFIVEGYMDVIALAQFGIDNAVASLGTAATEEHIEKLFRLTGKIIFCFDGDEAGKKAAWRALENALPQLRDGRQVNFIFLPEGEDPDSFVRNQGENAFLDNTMQTALSAFLFTELSSQIELDTLEGRALMEEKAIPLLAKIPPGTIKKLLVEELDNYIHTGINDIDARLSQAGHTRQIQRKTPASNQPGKGVEKIRWLIRCLLHRPEYALGLDSTEPLQKFDTPGIKFLHELLEFIRGRPNVTVASIIENWRDTKYESRLRELARDEDAFEEADINQEVFLDAIRLLIESSKNEFDVMKQKRSISDLTEAEKQALRDLQKT